MVILTLTIRFLLELAGFAAFGIVAATATGQPLAGVATALAVIVVWALVAAPRARNPLREPQRDAIGTGVLLLAAAGLSLVGHTVAGVALGLAVAANAALLASLGPVAREQFLTRAGHAR